MTARRAGDWIAQFLIIAGAIAGGPAIASAQTSLSLTLEQAIARAATADPRAAEAQARAMAAGSNVSAQSALSRPTATASGGYLRTNHVDAFGIPQPDGTTKILFPDIADNYRARAELDVPIYTGGRVDALVASARADEQAATADQRVTDQDIRMETTRAYWQLVTARETVIVLERALARSDAQVADVKTRTDAGFLPPNDLLSGQAQRARQNVQLIQARNGVASANLNLARLIGVDPATTITPATTVDEPTPGMEAVTGEGAEVLIKRALEQRAERASLTSHAASLRSGADVARAALRPQVGALAGVEPSRPNQRFVPRTDDWRTSWDLGVNVTWPLFDAGRSRAQAASATAQADAAAYRLNSVDQQISLEVRQRLLELDSDRAALSASGEAIAAATEATRVTQQRFAAGVATSTDVLDAQVAQLQAELERTNLAATLRLSEASLLRALGSLQ
jgi:outer membrane protein TolC